EPFLGARELLGERREHRRPDLGEALEQPAEVLVAELAQPRLAHRGRAVARVRPCEEGLDAHEAARVEHPEQLLGAVAVRPRQAQPPRVDHEEARARAALGVDELAVVHPARPGDLVHLVLLEGGQPREDRHARDARRAHGLDASARASSTACSRSLARRCASDSSARPGRSARSAQPMHARSTTSCIHAPTIAGRNPAAATSMSPTDIATPIEIDCHATRIVRRPTCTARARRDRSSTRITTSADSLAALEPRAPLGTRTSAAASTGASLTPSPTMRTGRGWAARTASTLSCGSRSARTSSIPTWAATCRATRAPSPVSTMTERTPARRSASIVARASGRGTSVSARCPAYRPSTATCTTLAPFAGTGAARPVTSSTRRALPTATSTPSTCARTPRAGTSAASKASGTGTPSATAR